MIRLFVQAVCVQLIAVGAGLFSFGSYLDPQVDGKDPIAAARQWEYHNRDDHFTASVCRGVGVGLLSLGLLGLIVPAINAMVRPSSAAENSVAATTPASSTSDTTTL
jgi:hypothetical protein